MENEQVEMNNEDKKRRRASTLFPKRSLLECLKIAESIRKNNNLKPYNRLTLASSLNYSPNSSGFRMLIITSNAYGLTTGSYKADKIALTPLGISIVSPKTDQEKNDSLKKALFNIPFFQKFFSDFNQGSVPRKDLLMNTLDRDYKIPREDCEACYDIIMKNSKELGILTNIKGTEFFQLDLLSSQDVIEPTENENGDAEPLEEQPDDDLSPPQVDQTLITSKKPRVFISHSKNKKIVEQIKKILEFGQFDHVIAEERETTAIPIAEKVFGLMKDCDCAIINLSVDEQEMSNEEYRINQNVLIEIGAAFLQYNKKVILLVDKRFSGKIPSNLDGLYRSEYEGNELSFDTAMKLQQALTEFRK